ncbi:MAG: hypothetical protein H8D34_30435 [Chloroflexi bacterium]|nr:hypothetical protein [Chloroflexota bacterium]
MLSHDLSYPEIPPIPDYPGISRRRSRWQRQAMILWLIAQGFSLRAEVQKIVASYLGISNRSGALMHVLSAFRDDELLTTQMLSLRIFSAGYTKLTLVCLADKGRRLAQNLGWQVQETEWERMQRLHEKGNDQTRHTAAVLAFVYQARLRGWLAGVMPEVDAGRFVPDVLVEKNGESYYVEVELGEQKPSKWHNMARHQGVIVLCGRTPEHRQKLLDEAKAAARKHNCPRLGTDLRTLFEKTDSPLWIDEI